MTRNLIKLLLLLLAPGALRAEFAPVFNGSLAGGSAGVVGQTPAALGIFDAYFVPAWASGSLSLLPVMSGSLGGQQRSIEEGNIFERNAQASFAPVLKKKFGQDQAVQLRLRSLRTWNLQTANETWGRGLYDYEQFGGGLAYERPWADLGATVELGADLAHRSYPNYRNVPEAAALLGGKNYYYKDFDSLAFSLAMVLPKAGLQARYSLEIRSFGDSYVVKNGGEIDLGTRQQDLRHALSLDGGVPFSPKNFLAYSLKLVVNDSNQNYYDTLAALPTFVPDYQDYSAETIGLAFPWMADALWQGLIVNPGYELTLIQSAKRAQNSNGTYTQDKVQNIDHNLYLGTEKKFSNGLSWLINGSYRIARSNQGIDRGVRNQFEFWQLTTGLKYTFKGK